MPDRIADFVEAMKIQSTDRVLEIGCGHGVAATLICEKLAGGTYLAIDRSRKMVEAASKRNRQFVEAGIAEFLEAEFESLDLGDRRFDKVLAMRVRLFHDRPDEAKRFAGRWLVPNGKLFVQYDEPGK